MQDTSAMNPDDFEVDASILFKQEASQLTTVKDLEDALSRYGYSKDDRISRRELAMMYSQIQHAMEDEIFRLANSAAYTEAKEMRMRLTNLRGEFDTQQTSQVANLRKSELEKFEAAKELLTKEMKKNHKQLIQEEREFFQREKSNEQLFHTIQTTNLEQSISLIPTPEFRGSKRLAELSKAEYNLNKSKAYDEAMKVRKMINKIQPKEEKQFFKKFDQSIEKKRIDMERKQKLDDDRVEEKLKKKKWDELRRREHQLAVLNQRVLNHEKDMLHMHTLESKLKPEMSVKPSALWQHRPGYNATSASLRGQQLLDFARGKKEGVAVFADSLVERHDYEDAPQNTTLLYSTHGRSAEDDW